MLSENLERLSKWVDSNLKTNPNSQGLLATKELIELTKQNVLEKTIKDEEISKAIELIKQIKIGNTPKYKALKSDAINILKNVLENLEVK